MNPTFEKLKSQLPVVFSQQPFCPFIVFLSKSPLCCDGNEAVVEVN